MANFFSNVLDKLYKREVDKSKFESLFKRIDVDNFFKNLSFYVDPDELALKIGDRKILNKLTYDGEIYAAIDKRQVALLTTKLTLKSDSLEVQKFMEDQILPFERQLKQDFWWAIPYGYNVEQIIYNEDRSGRVAGFQKEEFWRFQPMPDLIHVKLRYGSLNVPSNEIMDYGKFVLTVNNGTAHNPRGDAMFSRLYLPWLFKCNDWDLWMKFAERYALGFLHGKTPNPDDVDSLRAALELARKGSVLATTSNDEISYIQPSRDSSMFDIIDQKTTDLFYRVILGETQTSIMAARGSSASAEIQNDVRLEKTLNDINIVERSIEETMRQIAAVNGIDPAVVPTANLIYEQGLETQRASRDQILATTNQVRFTKKYFIDNYGFEADEIEIVEPAPPSPSSFFSTEKKSLFLTNRESIEYIGLDGCLECGGVKELKYAPGDKELSQREDIVAFLNRNQGQPLDMNLVISSIMTADNEKELDKNLLSLFEEDDPQFSDVFTQAAYYGAALGARQGNPRKLKPNEVEEFSSRIKFATKQEVTFEYAVDILKDRVSVQKYYYDELPKDLRRLSFYVSGLEKLREIELVKTSLANAISQGNSFKQWRDALDTSVLESLADSRLETVYRNNINTVYNQSMRYNAGTSGVTPYLMYTAVGDSDTRPSHQLLDGTIKKADSDFWDKYTPPIGHNCRCGVVNLDVETAKEMGISRKPTQNFPKPEAGFGDSSNKTYGNVLSPTKQAALKAVDQLPNTSPYKSRFKNSLDNVDRKVAIWWDTVKNKFE